MAIQSDFMAAINQISAERKIDKNKIEITIIEYGNVAAATIPLGISLALESKKINKGQNGLCIGLAGGISIGFVLIDF